MVLLTVDVLVLGPSTTGRALEEIDGPPVAGRLPASAARATR